jgi:tetratricopeptide (TPR) repeat protein
MRLWNSVFGGRAPPVQVAPAPDQAEQLFERALGHDPANAHRRARRCAAVRLVLAGETAKAREAWLAIARAFPADLADALVQVGVCHCLERDYRAALENFEAAIRVGADAHALDGRIADTRRRLRGT